MKSAECKTDRLPSDAEGKIRDFALASARGESTSPITQPTNMQDQPLTIQEEKPERAPVLATERGIQLRSMDEIGRFCLAVSKSRLAPKGLETPEAIMVAVCYGMEIGLPPMQAIQSVAVINGRPTLWGDAVPALIMARPDFVDMEETVDPHKCICTVTRKERTPVTRSFSLDDAKRAGLLGKAGPWQQYPTRMLQMRARSWAIRDAFPDALKGVQIREEVQDYHREPKQLTAAKLVMPDEEPAKQPEERDADKDIQEDDK
jgi:hypothetical protein